MRGHRRRRLRRAHRGVHRQVPGDDILGPMYPAHDLADAEGAARLPGETVWWAPALYQQGHHVAGTAFPFAIDRKARQRWLLLMSRALDETALPSGRLDPAQFFDGVSEMLINRADPDDPIS
jgi:hemoglobin